MKRRTILSIAILTWLNAPWLLCVQAAESREALCEKQAALLEHEGRVSEAIVAIENCLQQAPERAKSYVIYGDLLRQNGETEAALKAYDQARGRQP